MNYFGKGADFWIELIENLNDIISHQTEDDWCFPLSVKFSSYGYMAIEFDGIVLFSTENHNISFDDDINDYVALEDYTRAQIDNRISKYAQITL